MNQNHYQYPPSQTHYIQPEHGINDCTVFNSTPPHVGRQDDAKLYGTQENTANKLIWDLARSYANRNDKYFNAALSKLNELCGSHSCPIVNTKPT